MHIIFVRRATYVVAQRKRRNGHQTRRHSTDQERDYTNTSKAAPKVSCGDFNQALATGMLIHRYLVLSVLQVSLHSLQKCTHRETCQIV